MAFGIAVVASDLPGLTEAVQNDESGLVVPQDDPAALAKALETLAAQPEERRRLGNNARLRIHSLLDESNTEARLSELFTAACRKA